MATRGVRVGAHLLMQRACMEQGGGTRHVTAVLARPLPRPTRTPGEQPGRLGGHKEAKAEGEGIQTSLA